MKNAFYFMLKAIFFLKYMTFYPDYFDYLGKGLDRKPNVNFKIRDVTDWEANNYITHTV